MARCRAFLGILILGLLLAGCGAAPSARTTPSASPSARSTSSPSATPVPHGSGTGTAILGYVTAQAAADAMAHTSGVVPCANQYPGQVVLSSTQVSVYNYDAGPCGPGAHAGMFVWVYQTAGRWHPYTWATSQVANLPTGASSAAGGPGASIPMQTGTGCVNVHSAPSLSASVTACVGSSVTVRPADPTTSPWNPPAWADKKIWWYVFQIGSSPATSARTTTPLGWIDLDYLVCGKGPHDLNKGCTA